MTDPSRLRPAWRGLTPAQRLWARVDKSGECWLWTGSAAGKGYGRLRIGDREVYTHRLSYELAKGPIPLGMFVCHTCDVRRCVRPDHLFIGTCADNVADACKKGLMVGPKRPMRGESHCNARFTEADVVEILRLRGTVPLRELARRYGVSMGSITGIYSGKSWGHVTKRKFSVLHGTGA